MDLLTCGKSIGSFRRRRPRRLPFHQLLQRRAYCFGSLLAAAYEEADYFAFAVDDDRLRDSGDSVFAGHGAVAVEGDLGPSVCGVSSVDLIMGGLFFHIDGYQIDAPVGKFSHHFFDHGHALHARPTPGCPEIENHDSALAVGQLNLARRTYPA